MEVLCQSSQLLDEKALSIRVLIFHFPKALGRPVSQLSLFTATLCPFGQIHRTKADDGLNSRPPFITEAIKYQLSLLFE